MRSLAASLVVSLSLALALAACGGSTPAPDAPKADAPKADGDGAKKPDAKGGAGADAEAKKADAPKADDKKADAPKAEDKKTDAPKKDERLEDQTMGKTTSAGGSYALKVLSVAGMPVDDVGKALSASSGKVDACYAKLFKSALGQNGKTSVDVVVNDKGKTGSVKLRADETKNPELVKCLQDAVKAVEWPKPTEKAGGKTTIEWTLSGRLSNSKRGSGHGKHGRKGRDRDGRRRRHRPRRGAALREGGREARRQRRGRRARRHGRRQLRGRRGRGGHPRGGR